MFALERRQLIVREARKYGRVGVAEVARSVGVSTETVRRDLTLLEQQQILRRVHGGAVPIELAAAVPDVAARTDIMASAKRAIGKLACEFLPENGTILIDAGTTTAQLAGLFPDDRELTIVTNGLPIAESLVRNPLLYVHLLGGRLRDSSLATVDHWALEQLSSIDIDIAFVGTYGVSPQRGFSTPDSFEAAVKRAMLASAKKTIVLADSSKLGNSYMSIFAPLDTVDLMITDSGASREQVADLENMGLQVHVSNNQA